MNLQPSNSMDLTADVPVQGAKVRVEVPEMAGKLVDRLFVNLKAYSPAWKQAFETEEDYNETKQIWLQTLIAEGVCNASALKRGLANAAKSTSPFFPSIGQFVAWCRQEDFEHYGLPTVLELLHRFERFKGFYRFEQAEFDYKNQAEYWALCELYQKAWKKKPEDTEKLAQSVLEAAVKRIQAGEPFPDIPLRIEPPKTKAASAEFVDNILRQHGFEK